MQKNMKNYVTYLLLAAMLAGVSCGSAGTPSDGTTAAGGDSSTAETTDKYDPGLPEMDFGGYEFTFAVRGDDNLTSSWSNVDIVTESENGDVLNDAVYRRTAYIEDTYNVKINKVWGGDCGQRLFEGAMASFISKTILSDDNSYDAIISNVFNTMGFVSNEYLMDLNSLDHLDLSRAYWDQNVVRDLSLGDKTYFAVGDLTYIDNLAVQCMMFNKNVAAEYKIDPYQTVRDNKWTMDNLIATSKQVVRDMNGDTVMDESDRFGMTYWQDAAFSFTVAAGNPIGIIDEKGEPQLDFYSERLVNTWEKLIAFAKDDSTINLFNERKLYKSDGYAVFVTNMLNSNSMLYHWVSVVDLPKLRDANSDFGILPMPKYDEQQQDYISPVGGFGCAVVSVPITNSDPDRTGFILEAFCAKSAELVTPAFYEKTLTGKHTRDEESAEMLDIIYSTMKYDVGVFCLWGDITNQLMQLFNNKSEDISSMYESVKEKALADVQATAELFAAG